MTKYIEWKGAIDAGYFEYYDSEAGEKRKYEFKSIGVDETLYTVKGWDDLSNSAIYSNDIISFREGENNLVVRSKSGVLFEGPYDKVKIEALGGRIHIKIKGIDEEGEEVVLLLKGTNFFNINTLLSSFDTKKYKLKFKGSEEGKKGAVKYLMPIFERGDEL